VTGVAMVGVDLFVVCEKSPSIRVFDCDLQEQKPIVVEDLKNPTDMVGCAGQLQQLYIADADGVVLRVDVRSDHRVDLFVKHKHPVRSMSLTSCRLLLTSRDCLYSYNTTSGRYELFVGLPHDIDAWHAVEVSEDKFLVCHTGEQCGVSEIDSRGNMNKVYSLPVGFPCRLVMFDSTSRLLIADRGSGSIILLNERFEFEVVKNFRELDIHPRRLTYDRTKSRLFVGMSTGKVFVYDCMKINAARSIDEDVVC
jgi:hypothetical protein